MQNTLIKIRLVNNGDAEALYDLAQKTGGGMTNLPADLENLKERIAHTQNSAENPGPQSAFLFIAEEIDTGAPVGVAGLFTCAGHESGFFTYKLETHIQASKQIGKRLSNQFLALSQDYSDEAEIGSIFVDPTKRGRNIGAALVKACMLFIARNRAIFPKRIFAEMRGWEGPKGEKPFWDHFIQPFFDMDFNKADHLNGVLGNYFLSLLLPRHPIYLAHFPEEVTKIIGVPHDDGRRAFALLQQEGFEKDGHFDPFDLGPCLSIDIDALHSLKTAQNNEGAPDHISTGLVCTGDTKDFTCLYDAAQQTPLSTLLTDHVSKDVVITSVSWLEDI